MRDKTPQILPCCQAALGAGGAGPIALSRPRRGARGLGWILGPSAAPAAGLRSGAVPSGLPSRPNSRVGRASPPRDGHKAPAGAGSASLSSGKPPYSAPSTTPSPPGSKAVRLALSLGHAWFLFFFHHVPSLLSVSTAMTLNTHVKACLTGDHHLVLPCFKEHFASWRYPDQKIKRAGTASPAAMLRASQNHHPVHLPVLGLYPSLHQHLHLSLCLLGGESLSSHTPLPAAVALTA